MKLSDLCFWRQTNAKASASLKTLARASFCLLAVGCGGFRPTGANVYQIPWPDENGKYQLQNVPIESYDQPAGLQGRFVQIFVNPSVVDGQMQSEQSVGHYLRNRDGVMVPTDYTSVEAAAIHAHFERLLKMDTELKAVANWPARIAIDVNVHANGKPAVNNAFFTEELDALFLPPYTALDVPIAVNGGVLAHEHFHRIFQAMVFKRIGKGGHFPRGLQIFKEHAFWDDNASDEMVSVLPAEKDSSEQSKPQEQQVAKYNAFYLSALNEGLADFWGWVYTSDPNFIKASLPKLGSLRRLDVKPVERLASKPQLLAWTTGTTVDGKALTVEQLKANSYSVGTTYARFMRELTQSLAQGKDVSRAERMKMAAAVIAILPEFAEKIAQTIRARELINPNTFVVMLYPKLAVSDDSADSRFCRTLRRWSAPEWEQEMQAIKCIEPRRSTPRPPKTPVTPGQTKTPATGTTTPASGSGKGTTPKAPGKPSTTPHDQESK